MNKALVTGGAGFIGSHLCEKLVSKRIKVSVVDNLSTGRIENISKIINSIDFCEASILEKDSFIKLLDNQTTVFHLAALRSVPESFEMKNKYLKVNLEGTRTLLEACAEKNIKKFVFASSCSVYGEQKKQPLCESSPLIPASPYAETKLAGEQICTEFSKQGLDCVSLRYFNVYGPRQDCSGGYGSVIPAFVLSALAGKKAVIHGNGEQTRDFVFAGDVAEANFAAMQSKANLNGVAINIGSGNSTSVTALFNLVQELFGTKGKPEYFEKRTGDVDNAIADISLSEKLLSWQPQTSLKEGLSKTLESLRCDFGK